MSRSIQIIASLLCYLVSAQGFSVTHSPQIKSKPIEGTRVVNNYAFERADCEFALKRLKVEAVEKNMNNEDFFKTLDAMRLRKDQFHSPQKQMHAN